jgi:ABC-type multidrug transport system fused ATPase/permease subunit
MKDGDITKRLLKYAKPYWKRFVFVFIIMIFTIAADLVLPLITGDIVSILQTENFRYTQIAIMTTTWHSEKNQKYVKFDSIWMWVNAMLCQHICIPIPHEVRVKIVKRFNKLIDDKRRKLYIPTNKKCAS